MNTFYFSSIFSIIGLLASAPMPDYIRLITQEKFNSMMRPPAITTTTGEKNSHSINITTGEKNSHSINIPDWFFKKLHDVFPKPPKSFADLLYEFTTGLANTFPKLTLTLILPIMLKWSEYVVKCYGAFFKTIDDFYDIDKFKEEFSGFTKKITNSEIFHLLSDMNENEFDSLEKSKNLISIINSLDYNEENQTLNPASLSITKLYALKSKLIFYKENIQNLELIVKSRIKSFFVRLDPTTKLLITKKDLLLERIDKLITIIKKYLIA
jgi:hypothetical protein